jgi:hypothetical protein
VTRLPPPLRFLAVLVGLWTCVRAAVLAPPWWPAAPSARPPRPLSALAARPMPAAGPDLAGTAPSLAVRREAEPPPGPKRRRAAAPAARPALLASAPDPSRPGPAVGPATPEPDGPRLPWPGAPLAEAPAGSRWSAASWLFWRRGGGPGLAAGGALGGSQAGVRALYRLTPSLALSARLSAPLERPAGAEAALGLDWRPVRRLPLHLLAERRQALGRAGRSAFGLTVYGGVSDSALGRLRIDSYAQAGLVGARRRDAFADGALRLSLPVGRVKLGAAAWAAAQPGVARLDVGPQASMGFRIAGHGVTAAVDWRLRVAGNARPGSGPALTLASDF